MGSYPYPRNGILKLDYEFVLVFKKLGDAPKPTKEQKELSKMTPEEWNTFFSGHWNFSGEKQINHIAMFPLTLPYRLIKMFSFVGENILDPFLGSGTTALAAKNLNRNSIGYEINPDYIPFIKEKLNISQGDLSEAKYDFEKAINRNIDFEKEIKKLPYIFKDPHNFDKKIDVKKLNFGSKIEQNDNISSENKFYSVKKVLGAKKIILNDDLKISLIGIKENSNTISLAESFLIEKTKGKKVFLKFDDIKYDSENNLLCYLYLENKTFINAHLLKNKLADVDLEFDFKYKNKFLNILT